MDKNKGIVIAVPSKYENITLSNIQNIRSRGCNLPIEIWEVGNEISAKIRAELSKIEYIFFKNVADFTDNVSHWKGFQVKVFAFYYSDFEEVMLCDADVYIHQNPMILFDDKNYKKTGAYFFRDLEKWQFTDLTNSIEQFKQKFFYKKFKNAKFFLKRKKWLIGLLPEQNSNFPTEWVYLYDNEIPTEPVKEALQESGIVVMNKMTHKKSVKFIFDLNDDHPETYQYVWGDKETFWIGCVMANEPFYFNPSAGYMAEETGRLTHDYKGEKFFSQKG